MPVADTSFLVAFFDRLDPRHDEARAHFEGSDHVVIGSEVLVETLGVIKVKAGRQAAAQCLDALMAFENVGWEETCDVMAAYRIYRGDKSLSFVDSVVAELCVRLGAEPLAYDSALVEAVSRLGPAG